MRITESRLRRIVRQEIVRINEAGSIIPYSGEASAQGLTTAQQLGYAASRGVMGTTPMAAKQVAAGKVPLPSAGEIITTGWNSSIMDWTLTALGAMAEMIPGPGTVVSAAIAQVQLLKAAAKADWLGAFFSVIAMFPAAGDAVAILGRAAKAGKNIGSEVAQGVIKAITSISDDTIRSTVGSLIASLQDTNTRKKIADSVPQMLASRNKFVQDLGSTIKASAAPKTA
jgi:hypothetical protein